MEMTGALPNWLKVWWVCVSPFALAFAARIMWEKTVWTWSRGPQMVGFSLWHTHPLLGLVGLLSSAALALWLLIAIPIVIARRHNLEIWDLLVLACSLFVMIALSLPDTFFL